MNLSQEDSYEDSYPPLKLRLTVTPELISEIESVLPCPLHPNLHVPTERTLVPPETPTKAEKPKAMNMPVSKITIGQWTRTSAYPDDLRAKVYFAKKRLIWECLDKEETQGTRLKRKIEIHWADVLSLRKTFHSHDKTGTLDIELKKPPTFFVETNPQSRKHTQWAQLDEDFTDEHSASRYRRHTLHFNRDELQRNFGKLVSSDRFWSELVKVHFPTLRDSLYFDAGNNNVNIDILNPHLQGFGHAPVGDLNFNTATQFCSNDMRQIINPLGQDNRQSNNMNLLTAMQGNQRSSQPINNEHCTGVRFGQVPVTNMPNLSFPNDGRQIMNSSLVQEYYQSNSWNQLPVTQGNQPYSHLMNEHYTGVVGFGQVPMNNVASQFLVNDDGRQIMNSLVQGNLQSNIVNQLPGTQAIQPFSHQIQVPFYGYDSGRYLNGSQTNVDANISTTQLYYTGSATSPSLAPLPETDLPYGYESQLTNDIIVSPDSQANAQGLLGVQANSVFQHVNEPPSIFPQGTYLRNILAEEEERQNNLAAGFQTSIRPVNCNCYEPCIQFCRCNLLNKF